MKRIKQLSTIAGIALFIFSIIALNSAANAQSLTDSLQAWYKLDGNLADSSGNDLHLTELSGVNYTFVDDSRGWPNKALRSDGTNGFKSGYITNENWEESSISLWYKHEGHDELQVLVQGRDMGFGVVYRYPEKTMMNVGTFFDGSSADQFEFPGEEADTVWHHIVVTNDGDTTKGYLDGKYEGKIAEDLYNGSNMPTSSIYLAAGNSGYPFKGSLDDVRVYNRVLTPTEVMMLYNAPANTNNQDILSNSVRIDPNPATDHINISLAPNESAADLEVHLYNNLGQKVYTNTLMSESLEIDIESLPRGVYFISLIDASNGRKHHQKLILN